MPFGTFKCARQCATAAWACFPRLIFRAFPLKQKGTRGLGLSSRPRWAGAGLRVGGDRGLACGEGRLALGRRRLARLEVRVLLLPRGLPLLFFVFRREGLGGIPSREIFYQKSEVKNVPKMT